MITVCIKKQTGYTRCLSRIHLRAILFRVQNHLMNSILWYLKSVDHCSDNTYFDLGIPWNMCDLFCIQHFHFLCFFLHQFTPLNSQALCEISATPSIYFLHFCTQNHKESMVIRNLYAKKTQSRSIQTEWIGYLYTNTSIVAVLVTGTE